MRGLILVAILSVGALPAAGRAAPASEPICTDRPGKSSSTCTVPKSHWQFETGLVNWSETKSNGSTSTSLGLAQTAIKYGLGPHTHVEVTLNPWVRNTDRSASSKTRHSGVGDTVVKVKQELSATGALLSVAIVPHLKIPTAKRTIGNGRVEGGVIVPLSLQFGKSPWSLSASPELDASLDADRHGYHPYMAQTLSLGFQASEALSFSAELWGSWDWDETTTRKASFDPSVSYTVTKDFQLDLGANFGLNKKTADLEISGGLSLRY